MRCYFDNYRQTNLDSLPQISNVRSFDDFEMRYSHNDLNFTFGVDYHSPGIYFIEVSTHAHLWCSKNRYQTSFNVIEAIPTHIVDAVKLKKLRIVIIAVVEGGSFDNSEGVDAYLQLTSTMKRLGLPQYSVLIISGNLNADAQYTKWCKKHNETPWIEFSEGIDWTGSNWIKQTDPVFIESINQSKCFYNSLNRAHRSHRTEHLYFLAQRGMLDKGLVSGGIWFDDLPGYDKSLDPIAEPQYVDVKSTDDYRSTLRLHYPRTVDSPATLLRDGHFAGISNLDIFKDSLLTISTESHFSDNQGLFITEKTFRPIAMGHPFAVLGQPFLLKKLQSFGFKTDFIDTSYDEITDNKKRFAKFHESFLSWFNDDKEKYFAKWQLNVEHNLYVYQHLNFRKHYIGDAVERTTKYFKESF